MFWFWKVIVEIVKYFSKNQHLVSIWSKEIRNQHSIIIMSPSIFHINFAFFRMFYSLFMSSNHWQPFGCIARSTKIKKNILWKSIASSKSGTFRIVISNLNRVFGVTVADCQEFKTFSNFTCRFLIPIILANLNSNCSNVLDLTNLQKQVKNAFFTKNYCTYWTVRINSSGDLKKLLSKSYGKQFGRYSYESKFFTKFSNCSRFRATTTKH